jgi:hypothetical protein
VPSYTTSIRDRYTQEENYSRYEFFVQKESLIQLAIEILRLALGRSCEGDPATITLHGVSEPPRHYVFRRWEDEEEDVEGEAQTE